MSKLRVQSFAVSMDGYGAGPNQDLQNPLGVRGPELMEWFFPTRFFRKMQGVEGGVSAVRQYLGAGLIDELHLAMRPVLLGRGENVFSGLDLRALGYQCAKSVMGERAMHVFLSKP